MSEINIADLEGFEVLNRPVVAKRIWMCDFCGAYIREGEVYYWVRWYEHKTANFKCCKACAERYFQTIYERLRKKVGEEEVK
jgi:hypothetical protein